MTAPVKIFLADDDRWLLESMSDWLCSEGFAVSTADSIENAKSELLRMEPDLMLCDVRFEDGDGLKLLRHVRRSYPDLPIIMMSGYAGPDAARDALAGGAFELLSKPIIDEELRTTIQRALNQRNIEQENARLKEELDRRFGMESIVSHDLRMLKIFEMIDQVADTKATILITGENGTGKSMIARAIHKKSSRRKKPFVEVACGACQTRFWKANCSVTSQVPSLVQLETRRVNSCRQTKVPYFWMRLEQHRQHCKSNYYVPYKSSSLNLSAEQTRFPLTLEQFSPPTKT